MNTIEQRIWDYLDGTCSRQEKELIERLIETDPVYRAAYQELSELNQQFSGIELEEPSMAFTRNVMEKVKLEPVPGSIKSLIDKRIIYGIAAFFIFSILALLILAITEVNWAEPASAALPKVKVPQLNFSKYLNSNFMTAFFFIDTILGLYIMDSVLRKRMFNK